MQTKMETWDWAVWALVSLLLLTRVSTTILHVSYEKSGNLRENHQNLRPTDFKEIVRAASVTVGGVPSIMFAVADLTALVERLPMVLASLAVTDPAKRPQQHLVIGVQTSKELELCQQIHTEVNCWLDDHTAVPFVPAPVGVREMGLPETVVNLAWRKVEVARYILSLGVRVFGIDLDIVFGRDPLLLLEDPRFADLDFFAQSEGSNHTLATEEGHVNTGFYCLSPTAPAKHLLTLWLQDLSLWDQGAVQVILKEQNVPELKWSALPSTIAFSLCHAGVTDMGGWVTSELPYGNIETEQHHYAGRFEEFLVHNGGTLSNITVFHFPCLRSSDRKGALVSLALSAIMRMHHAPTRD